LIADDHQLWQWNVFADTACEELVNLVEKTGVNHVASHTGGEMHLPVLRCVEKRRWCSAEGGSDFCKSLSERVAQINGSRRKVDDESESEIRKRSDA
jgi:hypothetical protein